MKKLIYMSLIILGFLILTNPKIYAVENPYYDESYNQQKGAFYANGTDITIEEENGQTIIKWLDQQQKVPNTVTVFGGGQKGTHIENSNITMNSGTVVGIVGGGFSKEENLISKVENANITINGGTISSNITGGGYLYSQVNNTNITINGGIAETVLGGGVATLDIDGQMQYVGEASHPDNSPNRVNNATITINDITMPLPSHQGGIVYAGAQGYAFVGETNLIINGGNLSKITVSAGGSDDYVNKSNVTITGGDILLYQSINRGKIKEVNVKVTGGNIQEFNVGAKSDTASSGELDYATIYLLDGTIGKLNAGTVKSGALEIDKTKYKVYQVVYMTITNNTIPEEKIILVDYILSLSPTELTLSENFSKRINIDFTTSPEGYENLFVDNVKWKSDNEDVATVSEEGFVTAVEPGDANITASCFTKHEIVSVTVEENKKSTTFFWISWIIILLVIFTGTVILIFF